MGVQISLQKKKNAPSQNPFHNSSPYDYQMGFWGVVTEVHPEDCTVHVRMQTECKREYRYKLFLALLFEGKNPCTD